MKGIVSKMVTKSIYKKYGYKFDIRIDDLEIVTINKNTIISTNAEVKVKNEDFKEIISKLIVKSISKRNNITNIQFDELDIKTINDDTVIRMKAIIRLKDRVH